MNYFNVLKEYLLNEYFNPPDLRVLWKTDFNLYVFMIVVLSKKLRCSELVQDLRSLLNSI